jgi:hypothetical protein
MLNAGGFDSKDYPMGMQYYRLAVTGAGASAPVIPANGTVLPAWPTKASVISTLVADVPTRSGAGIYTCTVSSRFRTVAWLDISIDITGTPGAWGQVTGWNNLTGVISFRTFNAGGTATDMAVGDVAVFTISACDSSTVK